MPHRLTCSARCSCHYFVLLLLVHSQKGALPLRGTDWAEECNKKHWFQINFAAGQIVCRLPVASCQFPKHRTHTQPQLQSNSKRDSNRGPRHSLQLQSRLRAACCMPRAAVGVCLGRAQRQAAAAAAAGRRLPSEWESEGKGETSAGYYGHTHAPMQALWYRYGCM